MRQSDRLTSRLRAILTLSWRREPISDADLSSATAQPHPLREAL